MIRPIPVILLATIILTNVIHIGSAQEPTLQAAGAPYAPLTVTKNATDPSIPLSKSQRDELLGEFKGLVHMGLRAVSLSQWAGKEMADCEKSQRPEDNWSYRCEIITGQGNGYYYFSPTLKEVDVRLHASDERLLEDFRRPVQEMFGRATFVQKPIVSAKTTGPIRHWSTSEEVAELFMDRGSVRFIWMRLPAGRQSIPH